MDTPLELINGGHGVKNPLALDVPRPETDKLPPVRYVWQFFNLSFPIDNFSVKKITNEKCLILVKKGYIFYLWQRFYI